MEKIGKKRKGHLLFKPCYSPPPPLPTKNKNVDDLVLILKDFFQIQFRGVMGTKAKEGAGSSADKGLWHLWRSPCENDKV